MCGIWVYISTDKHDKLFDDYKKYYVSIKSRGPDETKVICQENFIACFHRLKINDLSSDGMQPFIFLNNTSTYYLLCNGEIYNYNDLKNKYKITTKSKSDCEIIYYLFILFNKDIKRLCIELNGEYAFVIIEELSNKKVNFWTGRDPYGIRSLYYGRTHHGIIFSSLLKGIAGLAHKTNHFMPGYYLSNYDTDSTYKRFYYPEQIIISNDTLKQNICNRLINSVKKRLLSDRPLGALLSGGLDSSLIVGILVKILGIKNLKTFSIGLSEKSPDLINSRFVANYLNTDHKEIIISPREALDAIENVIKTIETYDITTIRASTMQYMLAEYISKNTDIKVIFNGDGADEVQCGYLYYHYANNNSEALEDNKRLLNEISFFDVLRVDKCISNFGLEARVPYLDTEFVDYYLSLPIGEKLPLGRIEKKLIRDSFNELYPDILPKEVLYRKKEAFSDGVSTLNDSWYIIIQNYINSIVSDEEFENNHSKFDINQPENKEAYYYRKIFDKCFNGSDFNYDSIVPHYWLPSWIETNEPSARNLSIY